MRISDWSSDVCSSDLADDLYADGVANVDHLIRVIDPLVAKIRDVQQAINAAQVNKGAIIGDVLDHALDNLAFMQGLDKAAALLGAGFFQDGPARNHDVATAAIHFEDLERLGDVHERCYVAHRTNIDLAAGKESDGAVQIDSEAALDAAEDHA